VSAGQADASARPLGWLDDDEVAQIRCELASLRLELALLRVAAGGRKALHHSNFQPRVPAGNPDGGQWTDGGGGTDGGATGGHVRVAQSSVTVTDADGQPYYRPGGHHEMPEGVHKNWNLRPETRKVFENSTTGKLRGARIRTTPEGVPRGNMWDRAHRSYNTAVQELSDRFMKTNNLTPEAMTPDDARALLKEIRETNDPRIRNFNSNIRLLQRLFRIRVGRGAE
jgi:hypothetical protein